MKPAVFLLLLCFVLPATWAAAAHGATNPLGGAPSPVPQPPRGKTATLYGYPSRFATDATAQVELHTKLAISLRKNAPCFVNLSWHTGSPASTRRTERQGFVGWSSASGCINPGDGACDGQCDAGDSPSGPDCNGRCDASDSASGPDCNGACDLGDALASTDCDAFCGPGDHPFSADCANGVCEAGEPSLSVDCDGFCSVADASASVDCNSLCEIGDELGGADCNGTCKENEQAGSVDCDGFCDLGDAPASVDCNALCEVGDNANGADCNGVCTRDEEAGSPDCNGLCEGGIENDGVDCDGRCDQGDLSSGPDCNGGCNVGDAASGPDCDGVCKVGVDDPGSPDCAPLPAELLSFVGTGEACAVAFAWETASEVEVQAFELQSLLDGVFEPLARVQARGGEAQTSYDTVLQNLPQAATIFRLATQDVGGAVEYADAIVVDRSTCAEAYAFVAEPSLPHVLLTPMDAANANQRLEVLSMATGQLQPVLWEPFGVGVRFLTTSLRPGMYVVRVKVGGRMATHKFIRL